MKELNIMVRLLMYHSILSLSGNISIVLRLNPVLITFGFHCCCYYYGYTCRWELLAYCNRKQGFWNDTISREQMFFAYGRKSYRQLLFQRAGNMFAKYYPLPLLFLLLPSIFHLPLSSNIFHLSRLSHIYFFYITSPATMESIHSSLQLVQTNLMLSATS